MDLISIVIPCYNEQESIPLFYMEICGIAKKMKDYAEFEIIFVDDGSSDKTLEAIKSLCNDDNRIRYISFSRNFGKESAIYAGLKKSSGKFISIMDVDLQDPPELLIEMYKSIVNEGYDCVATRRVSRKGEPLIRSIFARAFYRLINKISDTQIVDGARDYRLMTRYMVDSILSLQEYNRFSKGIFSWVGYKTKWLEYENIERTSGQTKWSFWKLLKYSLEGIIAFSTAPLVISSVLGVFLCIISLFILCSIVVKTLFWGQPIEGYSLLLFSVIFIGGIQILCTGILGQYLSKTYLETKKRPIYISKEEK